MIDEFEGTFLFVGAGKMGSAVLAGLLEEGIDPGQVIVQDPSPSEDVQDLFNKYDIQSVENIGSDLDINVVFLAVKPQVLDDVLKELAGKINSDALIISIAAGKTLCSIESHFTSGQPVVRAMPNTPAAIGRGMSALVANSSVQSRDKKLAEQIFSAIGAYVWVENEDDMDAVTALSGSGPAYVFLLTECMTQAGMKLGLSPEVALQLAKETVSGSGELMRLSDNDPSLLRENVTSPAGTTEAALKVLMDRDNLKTLMEDALLAAKARSKELSG